MKRLFYFVFGVVVFTVGTPVLLLGLMYDSSGEIDMPTYLYTSDADYQKMLYQELDDSLNDVENGNTVDMEFNLTEDIINTAIFNMVREETNPDYMPNDNCDAEENKCNYIIYEPFDINEDSSVQAKLVGVWVELEDVPETNERIKQGKITINAYLEVDVQGSFTYETLVQTSFIITDNTDDDLYKLEFDQVKAGKLPLPKSLFTTIINASGFDLESEVSQSLEVGEFDQSEMSYSITKKELVDNLNEDTGAEPTPEQELTKEVLGIIMESYVSFDGETDEIILSAGVSLLKNEDVSDIPAYLYDLHQYELVNGEKVYGEFDPEAFDPNGFLSDSFAEYIFNRALTGEPEFYINESVVNKLIYSQASGFADMTQVQSYTDSDGIDHEIEIGLSGLWFEFEEGEEGEEVYAKALFKVAGINSLLEIRTVNISPNPQELILDFNRITIGKDDGEEDGEYTVFENTQVFKDVLASMDSIEFATFNEAGQLIISSDALLTLIMDSESDPENASFDITALGVVEGALYLAIEPQDAELNAVLQTLTENLNTVISDGTLINELGDALDLTDPDQLSIYTEISEMQTDLIDGNIDTNIDPEEIEDIFTTFETLDSEAQDSFIGAIEGSIDQSTFDQLQDLLTGGN